MKALRPLWVCILLGLLISSSYAGSSFAINVASGEVVYKRTFKVHTDFTDEDAFTLVQNWFNSDASKFTCQNTEGPNTSCKNKTEVEEAFNNPQPLQSLDPSSGRMSGRGLLKYYGNAASTIGVLYMEYYLLIEINGHQVTATISRMKYHHYNQHTYAAKPIYSWQGGKPLDSADKLANLLASDQSETRDIIDVGNFVNENAEKLFNDLELFLQNKRVLSENN